VPSRARLWPAPVALALAAVALALVAAACGGSSHAASQSPSAVPTGPAPTPTPLASGSPAQVRAAQALAAFDQAFYVQQGPGAYDKLTTLGRRSDFWRQAEFIELAADAYQHTGDPAYQQMVASLRQGVSALWGRRWTKRTWNDDIMWMVLASVRAYQVTGQRRFLTAAKINFDATYARAWSSDLGGGLWWTTSQTQKNNTTNGPAALAACLLYQSLHDPSYLTKAEALFGWVQQTLYDPATGALADSISISTTGGATKTVVNHVDLSYNYGSFIGAAGMLYKLTGRRSYYDTGLKALAHARRALTYPSGILRSESNGRNQNGGGFKGIFSRWALRFVYDNNLTQYLPWFERNAAVAWSHRNAAGLMGQDWTQPTGNGAQYSFDCYSGVALLQALAGG
jgi:predicted alpha-1,6-mannanase (GH76 family)